MFDNYNYPPGTDNEDAPWNERAQAEKDFDVTVSQTLSKTVTIATDDYFHERIVEWDDMGGIVEENFSTADTDWKTAFAENESMTPLELIKTLKNYLQDGLEKKGEVSWKPQYVEHLIQECEGWIEDETVYIED